MALFFNNIHIKSSEVNSEVLKDQIINRIKEYHINNDYEFVEDEDSADKSVIINFSSDSPWVSIYDEEGSYNLDILSELGKEFSKQQSTHCITIHIVDNDYITMGLFKNGKYLEQMTNLYLLIDLETDIPEIWAELTPNQSFEDIKDIWRHTVFSTTNFLKDFSKLINIPSYRLLSDYYIAEKETSPFSTSLHFADKKTQKSETIPNLVSFQMLARKGSSEFKLFHVKRMKWIITNAGDASTGMNVLISGGAIDKLYVMPTTAKISYYNQEEYKEEYTCEFRKTGKKTKDQLFYISIPKLFIPKGKEFIPSRKPNKNKQNLEFLYSRAIQLEIEFLGLNSGEEEMHLFVMPFKNKENGFLYDSIEITVSK